jgi:hypothetical protein
MAGGGEIDVVRGLSLANTQSSLIQMTPIC